MSKLITDSPTLMRWFDAVVNEDDCAIAYLIKSLRQSVVDISIVMSETRCDEHAELLKKTNNTVIAVMRDLQCIRKEVQQ